MAELVREQAGSARAYTPLEKFPEPVQTIFRAAVTRAETNLVELFKGITADGTIVPDLFPLNRTGVSLAPVAAAARSFLASLDAQERATASFELENEWWRKWHNMHVFFFRHGVCLYDLDDTQRAAALEVVRSALSTAGFENARDVMKLNEHIAELTGRREEFGEWYYYLSIFGEPSETEPWGW